MKNRIFEAPECYNVLWTNSVGASGTGAAAAVASGDVVSVNGKAHIAFGDIATSATGTLVGSGTFQLTAVSGDTWAVGARLGYNFTTKKIDPLGPALFVAASAKTSGQTTAEATILLQDRSTLLVAKTVSAGEDSANQADFVHTRGANPNIVNITLRSTAGVSRACTVTFPDVNTVRVAEASMAVNETIQGEMVWTI